VTVGARIPEPAWRQEGTEPALLSTRAGLMAGEPWLVAIGLLLFGASATATLLASAGGVASVVVSGGAT
jgi:hypothetical protein